MHTQAHTAWFLLTESSDTQGASPSGRALSQIPAQRVKEARGPHALTH